MDSEYDRKFEEMKKYIPFLESMIKRLESTSSASANPRQAQLDKIRSLRDLLLDQKKRMKMENLLKCEQVLVNLYAKVEQRDINISPKSASTAIKSENNDLEKVRSKLKSVVSVSCDESQDTLPEIARANKVEETCTPGSKEPALFQRRPNKTSLSPVRNVIKSPIKPINSKRNYTRVLLSPEPSNRRWENNDKIDKPLFSRRSPRRSPKRSSPTYNKKERKKSKQKQSKKGNLNITLNVPEDMLNSKDILSRIMNCNDNDVDIETLREAKRQILNELKQTGAKCDDISDLLLKSYKKKGNSKKKNKKDDVEEGELSDSESEAISSIYDDFILDNGNDNSSKGKSSKSQENPRKIQICLVINPDKDAASNSDTSNVQQGAAADDLEMYDKKPITLNKENSQDCEKDSESTKNPNYTENTNDNVVGEKKNDAEPVKEPSTEDVTVKCTNTGEENKPEKVSDINVEVGQPANFYTPVKDDKPNADTSDKNISLEEKEPMNSQNSCQTDKETSTPNTNALPEITAYLKSTENEDKEPVEIPLLHDQSVATQKPKENVVSEIDILQALKNEILGEPMSIPVSETTPLMHQPKLTKVASVQEIVPKKRISIEKYKKKSVTPASTSLFVNDPFLSLSDDNSMSSKEDSSKKQSLKLTEKECERFNFPTKLALDDDDDLSDKDLESDFSLNDIYGNLAPKSPDSKDASNIKNDPPVIIPVDPIKTVTPSKLDVDMRTLTPNVIPSSSSSIEVKQDKPTNKTTNLSSVDPRMKRDLNQAVDKDHNALLPRPLVNYQNVIPNATKHLNPSMTPKRSPLLMTPIINPNATPNWFPNMTPSRVPNMTSSIAPNMTPTMAPNMTPSRNPNMTPSSRNFDFTNQQLDLEDNSARRHVYAPMFQLYDHGDTREHSLIKEQERRPHWEQHEKDTRKRDSRWGDTSEIRDSNLTRDPRSSSVHRETSDYSKSRYNESHNNYDSYNSRFNERRDNYSRTDCPRTPLPSFGRSDAPMTPIHPFGRSDCPQTPNHPFGRSDCPLTPSHPFGRSDCPQTPSHPFGRSDFCRNDGSMTPSHSFGRVDMPSTPSHPFGRSENQRRDPRLNRFSDQDNFQNEDADHMHYKDRKRSNFQNSYRSESNKPDTYRNYREHSVGRNERSNYPEHDSHHFKDQNYKRDSSDSRAMSRDFETERYHPRDRGHGFSGNDFNRNHDDTTKGFVRERSVGRGVPNDSRMHPSSRRFDGRAQSVGRTKDDTDNRLRVKPDTGSSFTIDTSVRSTFQDFLREDRSQASDFNDRRRRASSVGRTLCRETSVGRTLPNQHNPISRATEYLNVRQNNFRRARSVGRDILASEKERSFKDLKEDFQRFYKQLSWSKSDSIKQRRNDKSSSVVLNNTLKRDVPGISGKITYSPRKNFRDPRMRRELETSKNKHRNENTREHGSKNVGLVYSNDNITKGTVLGSGYGVKNYKIPKIKRSVEEQKQEEEKQTKEEHKKEKDGNKTEEKNIESITKKNNSEDDKRIKKKLEKNMDSNSNKYTGDVKEIKKKEVIKIDSSIKKSVTEDANVKNIKNKALKVDKDKAIISVAKKESAFTSDEEVIEKRVTRLSKKGQLSSPSSNDSTISRTKKTRKAVIYDSEDEEDQRELKNDDVSKLASPSKTCTDKKQSASDTNLLNFNDLENVSEDEETLPNVSHIDKQNQDTESNASTVPKIPSDTLDNENFAIDDLESFSDNLASDSVIDNINALIADLDNDLEPSKQETNDKSISNAKINTDDNTSKPSLDSPKKVVALKDNTDTEINKPSNNKTEDLNTLNDTKALEPIPDHIKVGIELQSPSTPTSNDNLVTTTEIIKASVPEKKDIENDTVLEGSPTPDSTNEVSKNPDLDVSLPDSTNEAQTDINSVVTSSHDSVGDINKDSIEPCSSNKNVMSNNSIDNILSILKNKSKLKEIFSMLGDQSNENEKIKKKLEKLCAIVSDDEEDPTEVQAENSALDVSGESGSKDDEKEGNQTELLPDLPKASNLNLNDAISDMASKNETNLDTVLKDNDEHSNNLDNYKEPDEKEPKVPKKQQIKRGKISKRGKGGKSLKATISKGAKRITRSAITKVKKPSRELLMLQEDLKEMFMSDDVLNATGIRMCRLAKLVDDNSSKLKEDITNNEPEPVVILEKFKAMDSIDEAPPISKPMRKKPGPKPKIKPAESVGIEEKTMKIKPLKHKPGPKSKTKQIHKSDDDDPYAFESDSVSENNESLKSVDNKERESSDSENDSLVSSQSFGSTELLVELKKKPKRKRFSWQSGVIRPKHRKKKSDLKPAELQNNGMPLLSRTSSIIPDPNCFTDKSYCFYKNISTYSCRLCMYSGEDIVNHYKQEHPHSEIPLSRLSPEMAKEAIEQCEEINFQAISKVPSDKYVCRFCFKKFGNKAAAWRKCLLEEFFWHVVSMHTGEYIHSCSCVSMEKCPFNLDIPPPPKDGQLIGYICEKCNFTQISLENLKTHVIVRHNDEQTEVYTINLAVMSRKAISELTNRTLDPEPEKSRSRVLRSRRSNPSITEASDDQSDVTDSDRASEQGPKRKLSKDSDISPTVEKKTNTKLLSKIAFENDDSSTETSNSSANPKTLVKKEPIEEAIGNNKEIEVLKNNLISEICGSDNIDTFKPHTNEQSEASNDQSPASSPVPSPTASPVDIKDCAHFKVSYTDSGSKEYVCCVNGIDNHYRTALLISMKKHVQLKHTEIWDGYCVLCKVIVTPQGRHKFKDCLQHYLDKHMDSFPVIEKVAIPTEDKQNTEPPEVRAISPKPYINVRPLSDLMSKEAAVAPAASPAPVEPPTLPKIENVMSLGPPTVEPSKASPSYPNMSQPKEDKKVYKYEEVQAEVMSNKHRVVLDTMMNPSKLVNVFKCAGRYCSFTSDSAEEALLHASTHKRVGGESSLICAYCDFDCSENAIDLVMHVFKAHGSCPFCCAYCFYRAAASQLVTAHISRIHRDVPPRVLSTANAAPPPVKDASLLSREDVVKYYVCPHACKFKAYTAGKFCEHMLAQHASELSHPCNLCTETRATPPQLVQHLKSHQLNVYQCTWCVHGADSEAGLLLHAAHTHPDKQPQAYLRVIQKIDKGASSQLRVLPLVSFTKTKVNVEVVAAAVPSANAAREAEREAERSIELEKLIGHTKQLIAEAAPPQETDAPPTETETAVTNIMTESEDFAETIPPTPVAATIDPEPLDQPTVVTVPPPLVTPQPTVTTVPPPLVTPQQTVVTVPPPLVTPQQTVVTVPPPLVTPQQTVVTVPPPLVTPPPPPSRELAEQVTPKIKIEPVEKLAANSISIVCLDSDEEDSRDSHSVIALSDEETTTESPAKADQERKYKTVPLATLFKCPSCYMCYKVTAAFKRHTNVCVPREWLCPHCGLKVANREDLIRHYHKDHTDDKCLNICKVCDGRFPNLSLAKAHMKSEHSVTKVTVMRKVNEKKETEYVLSPAPAAPASAPKRKRSSSGAPEPPPKIKRFSPQDVDQLPINPILDEPVACSLCEFKTKVRLNMVRHLQLHAEQQPVPQTAPINPVPHLETNEMHFDKMVNLASSSIVTRAPEKTSRPESATVSLLIPPEAASRYPKYVPDRQRHTCGAKGCSYISVDEAMLRCHWETLHSGSNDFHCVHCPPYQHLDTSKPLTAARIIAHLKMHDATLYACSSCAYYHYRKQLLEKHLAEVHKGSGRVMVVREEVIAAIPGPSSAAPTMDLKPWQCGLCNYKSMLRPDVAEHCAKAHLSKMQFKCFYCPFRTSALENVTKHQANAHPKKSPEVFYYYYREGSIPDEPDGTPRWVKQRQKFSNNDPEVKSETADPDIPNTLYQLLSTPPKPPPTPPVDLNIVKKEVEDICEMSVEQLLGKFGQVCEPNGLRYKCPLCNVVTEDTKESMQFHLYEELKYRKWVCSVCSYKAFHKTGLNKHIESEHSRLKIKEPTQLPVDSNIEKWVEHILQHQTTAIEKNRENFAKQKIISERPPPPSTAVEKSKPQDNSTDKFSMKELEQAFGPFGAPSNMMFCCPKCDFKVKDEAAMKDHLEMELSKIRWSCSNCSDNFQTYHEAQFHCKSVHAGVTLAARPVEAPRTPAARAAWPRALLQVQRLTMNHQPAAAYIEPAPSTASAPAPAPDDLLVVRYEEPAPNPEQIPRKRPAEPAPETTRKQNGGECRFCPFKTRYNHVLRDHMYRHYDLKPFECAICNFNGYRATVINHVATEHASVYKPELIRHATLPTGPPSAKLKKLNEPKTIQASLETDPLDKTITDNATVLDSEEENEGKSTATSKRVAKKSTTKLPAQAVAKKSTTKLPYDASDEEEEEEYSYYGAKLPSPSKYENVTTLMSFYNTMVPFTMKKLSEVLKINPCVRVEDVAKRPKQ